MMHIVQRGLTSIAHSQLGAICMNQHSIVDALRVSLAKTYPDISADVFKWGDRLSKPPKRAMGDIAFACFELAKAVGKPPPQVARLLAENLPHVKIVVKVEAKGSYVNFFLDRGAVIKDVCEQTLRQGARYGYNASMQGHRMMVEFSSPNTNKPLHLGHLRNTLLGDALSYILQANDAEVVRANLVNDRGIHICKTILAYQKWANGATPESLGIKGDHYVGDLYVQFEGAFKQQVNEMGFDQMEFEAWATDRGIDLSGLAGKEVEARRDDYDRSRSPLYQEAQGLLKYWEEGDTEIHRLWKMMNEWVMNGFKETYDRLGVVFDRYYLESETYSLGKSLVEDGLARGVFERDTTGAVVADLRSQGLGKKVLLRPDGTSIYITQDLGTTVLKQRDLNLTHSICVVAREQEHHFKVLAKLLELLGYEWAGGLYHLSYGLVHLPEGRMKSREGTVVDIDDFLRDLFNLALEEIKVRANVTDRASQKKLARAISLGAAKFGFLSVDPIRDTTFDPKALISFEGRTGPYIQYANARVKSILAKAATADFDTSSTTSLGGDAEIELASTLADYPAIVEESGRQYNPSLVANYLYQLAQTFTAFYHAESVLKEENQERRRGRLALCAAVSQVLSNGLGLLGIEAPETM
jgi:arginyl-tRNA synthetase